jgi:hypothetical protein
MEGGNGICSKVDGFCTAQPAWQLKNSPQDTWQEDRPALRPEPNHLFRVPEFVPNRAGIRRAVNGFKTTLKSTMRGAKDKQVF